MFQYNIIILPKSSSNGVMSFLTSEFWTWAICRPLEQLHLGQ